MIQKGITATVFGGPGDEQSVAYPDVKPGWANRPGCALPFHFSGPRPRIKVSNNSRSILCDIVDVGPWYPSARGGPNAYWLTNARPRAESDANTNTAGIDLTPAAARAIGIDGKGIVDWEFVSESEPAPPATTTSGGWLSVVIDVLVAIVWGRSKSAAPAPSIAKPPAGTPPVWPLQSECLAFYGDPREAGWLQANTVHVQCPWPLFSDGVAVSSILIHKKCADSLARILARIWDECGRDAAKIRALRYDQFDGSYNLRAMRGSSQMSMHSFACAIDWDAADNPFHEAKHLFTDDSPLVKAFKAEGWVWGGDWHPASMDAMHCQAARIG